MVQPVWNELGPPLARIHASDQRQFDEFVSSSRPVLVEGALDEWPALSSWNFEYIASRVGERKAPVEFYPNGTYYERWLTYEMQVKRYLNLITAPPGPELYYMAEIPLDKAFPELAADIKRPSFIEADRLQHTALFLGKDTTSALHYHDIAQALLCQVVGQKRVFLFSPEDFRHLPFEPWYSSCFNFSTIDFNNPDVTRFPSLKRAKPLECVLKPGDALFIPMHWGHIVEGEGNNASVTFFWRSRWHHWKPRQVALHAFAGFHFRSRFLRPLAQLMESRFGYQIT